MIVIRKLKTAAFLLSHWTTRALLRVRNLLRKRARHYGKRAVWAWKDLSERAKNARIAARNLSHKAVDRVLNLRKPFIRFARRRKRAAQLHDQVREEQKVEARALKLAGSGQPIILGPWISEVGFEVLYWIPFLAWLRAERGWDASRVAAVSRGGVRSWYSGLADHYVEIFDCFSPDEFAARNASRREATEGTHKQLEVSDLDQELVA
ncbi:MAG: hypothetical protein NTY02_19135, partial [Acidobacteria bacterium]|nr:hypothetical protein [Acidobacteriota bacterium]